MVVLLATAGFIAFEVCSLLWSADSRERFDSPEWERRRKWRAFR